MHLLRFIHVDVKDAKKAPSHASVLQTFETLKKQSRGYEASLKLTASLDGIKVCCFCCAEFVQFITFSQVVAATGNTKQPYVVSHNKNVFFVNYFTFYSFRLCSSRLSTVLQTALTLRKVCCEATAHYIRKSNQFHILQYSRMCQHRRALSPTAASRPSLLQPSRALSSNSMHSSVLTARLYE